MAEHSAVNRRVVGSSPTRGVIAIMLVSYKENIVRKFYDDFFCKLDRQIILVDCFKALLDGKETYRDLNDTLDILLSNFQYGRSNLFNRLFSPKIDKVIFAATKADMVTIDQHGRLMNILKTMVSQSFRRVKKCCPGKRKLSGVFVLAGFFFSLVFAVKGRDA